MAQHDDIKDFTEFRTHLINAYVNWLTENNCKTHLSIRGSAITEPKLQSYIKRGALIINVTPGAVEDFFCVDGRVSFRARFSGVPYHIDISVRDVVTIFAPDVNFGLDITVIGIQDEWVKTTLRGQTPTIQHIDTVEPQPSKSNVTRMKPGLKIVK